MNKWFQLGDFVEAFLKGITPKYIDESDVIVLNQKCIRNNKIDYKFSQFHDPSKTFNDKKILRIGDLLFNSTGQGTAGRCAFVKNLPKDKKVITDSHILIIRIDDYYLAECFSYSFYKEEKFIQSFMDGSTGQGELDKMRLFNVEFRLPEKSNRKAICEFFNSIDQKIELNNQINIELEGLAKLVYDYWFVQFDFPDANGKPYKAFGGKMVYNEVLKREIPEGWEYGKANKLIRFNPTESLPNGKLASYFDMNALPTDGYMTSEVQNKAFFGGMKFKNDDVLVARITPCLENGKTCLVTLLEDDEVGFGSTEYIVLRGQKKPIPAFVSFLARSEYFRKYAITNMSGTSGRKRVDYKQLELIPISIPPTDLLDSFESLIYPHFEKMTNNTKENQELSSLRNWLLPMLMNGQVNVKEASSYGTDEVEKELGPDNYREVAEDSAIYNTAQNIEDMFPTLNYGFELAAVVLLTEQRFRRNYGKKYLHKMFSNMQFLATLPKINELQFAEKGWGMFSKGLAKSIDKEVYIQKSTLENAYSVYKVKSNYYKVVTNWINNHQNKLFVSEVNAMLSVYEKPLIKGSMDRIELLNTVLECIKVLGTYKFPLIYNKMKTWKMEEPEFEYKANKFKPAETMHMVALVRELKMRL